MHKHKRVISFMLVILFIFTTLTAVSPGVWALNRYIINGKVVTVEDFTSSSGECWEYANKLYEKIWGTRFNSYLSSSDNFLRDLPESELTLTAEHLKEYVSAAELGSVLRICNKINLYVNDGYIGDDRKPGHSMIIVQKDENGFTILQGGLSAYPHRSEVYYTWESFIVARGPNNGGYQFIKYIKWPSAPSYAQVRNVSEPTVANAVYPSGTLMYGKKFSLSGVIYSTNILSNVSATITDMDGTTIFKYDKRLSTNTYNISKDGLDNAFSFGLLPCGGYTYEVKVKNVLGVESTIIKSFFVIAASKVVNEEKIYNFLINNGFTIAAACGVLSNIECESYFNPLSLYYEVGDYYSHGLIQWNHGRYDNLIAFCEENGYDVDSMEGQLLFMMKELREIKYYKEAWNAIQNEPNTSEGAYNVAYDFCYYYEMPSDTVSHSVYRGELAQSYFERYTRGDAYSGNVDVTVSFNSRGGGEVSPISTRFAYTYGTLPTPTRSGYDFLGWFTEAEGGTRVLSTDTVWVTKQQLLYAHWKGKTYTIHYVFSDNEIYTESYVYGDSIILPKNPVRDGCSFQGWYDNPLYKGSAIVSLVGATSGNKTFYAKWGPYTGLLESEEDGFIRYFQEGVAQTGFKTIGNNELYFEEDGTMSYGPVTVDGVTYTFEDFSLQGMMLSRVKTNKNGIYLEEFSARYYVNNVMKTGWREIGGNTLYFSSDGLMVSGTVTIDGKPVVFEEFTYNDLTLWREVKEGLREEDGGLRFYKSGKYLTGWVPFGEKSVYFDPNNGLMVTEDTTIGNVVYHFEPFEDENGYTLYGSVYVKQGFFEEEGGMLGIKYYINGEKQYGWQYPEEIGGREMFFDRDSGNMWKTNGNLYQNYAPKYCEFGTIEYNGFTLYYVMKNGFYAEDGGIRYYEHDICKTGLVDIDIAGGVTMFFDKNGLMLSSSVYYEGFTYTFTTFEYNGMTLYKTRRPRNGFLDEGDGGIRYYVNDVAVKSSFVTLDDEDRSMVYFDENGFMNTRAYLKLGDKSYRFENFLYDGKWSVYRVITVKNGFYEEDGGVRYYDDGNYETGFKVFPDGTLYFDRNNGLMASKTMQIGSDHYRFEPFTYQGITLYRAILVKNGFYEEEGGLRYYISDEYRKGFVPIDEDTTVFFDENGLMYTGSYLKSANQSFRFEYVDYGTLRINRLVDPKNGFYEEDGGVRYYDGGVYVTGFRAFTDGTLYFDADTGLMVSGDTQIGGDQYRFEPFTYQSITLYRAILIKNGFYEEDGGLRYYVSDEYKTGLFVIDEDTTVFFDENGFMYTGSYLKSADQSFRFEYVDYGTLRINRLVDPKNGFYEEDGGVRYYIDGEAAAGELTLNEDILYFDPDSKLMVTENFTAGNKEYVFSAAEGHEMTVYTATVLKNGLYEEEGEVHYYAHDVLQTGEVVLNDEITLLFDENGQMQSEKRIINGVAYGFVDCEYQGVTVYRVIHTGVFNISDVSTMLNYLSGATGSEPIPLFADMNGDGRFDISDVSEMLNFLSTNQ